MARYPAPWCPRRIEAMLLFATALGLPGCPLSDDYFIDSDLNSGMGGSGGDTTGKGDKGGTGGIGGTGSTGSTGSTGGIGGSCTSCGSGCTAEERPGKTYLFCTTEQTFATAQQTCANAGMSLVIINDAPEDTWVWTTLERSYDGIQAFAFIGASDQASEGDWRFADGTQFWSGGAEGMPVGSRYVHWGVDEPDELSPISQTDEDCGSLQLSDGTWNDVPCGFEYPFVCESP